jgi:hypothetical protein
MPVIVAGPSHPISLNVAADPRWESRSRATLSRSGADILQSPVAQTSGITHAAERCIDHVYRYHAPNRVGLQLVGFSRKQFQCFVIGFSHEVQIIGQENLRHVEHLPRRTGLGINTHHNRDQALARSASFFVVLLGRGHGFLAEQ